MEERIPPHSIEAEKSVLGAALLSKDALFDVMEVVKADDFYDANHKEIFLAMLELNRRNAPVDALTVSEELKKRNSLNMVGGRAYIAALSSAAPSTANAMEYGKIVSEKAVMRRMIAASDDIVEKGYSEEMTANQLLDYAEKSIFELSQLGHRKQYTHIKDVLLENIDAIDKASKMEGGLTGLTTGFKKLDELTAGLQRSDLIILAARPAMGKTSFALSLALNAAVKGNASVLMFSIEMPKEQLGQKLLSMESKVRMQDLKTGKLDRQDWDDINIALDVLSNTNIHIDEAESINTTEMKSKCRRLKVEKGLDLVIIDYLQMMQENVNINTVQRSQELSLITRNLKLMAKELDCPVLVLSQLNRNLEGRTDRRPILADLRDSGSIEQDADLVMFLYRDEYYNPDTENPGECEVILSKHRNGPTGTIKVTWLDMLTKFVDTARQSDIQDF